MTLSTIERIGLFAILAIVMAATRVNHFAALPDASWVVFFAAGFYLRGSARWAFVLLIAIAVLVDFFVITGQGLDFWSHYCMSVAYWFLLPAYGALWFGGSLLRKHYASLGWRELGLFAALLFVSVSVCYLVSNGSYYWLADHWLTADKTRSFSGWIENLGDWYVPYLKTSAMYGAIFAVAHALVAIAARSLRGASASSKAASVR